MSGSDQYGNIVAGMDLIRREFGEDGDAYAITAPLVMGADGKKIGKTEKGAVWLNRERTSPYAFYQYWVNIADADVISFLKKFTLLNEEEIAAIEEQHEAAPHRRVGQLALAEAMTELTHGAEELKRCLAATDALFGKGDVRELDAQTLKDMFADVPYSEHAKSQLSGEGIDVVDVLAESSLAKSKREAREFVANGAVAINGQRVERGEERRLTGADLLHDTTILLKRGKKLWHATAWK